MATGTSRSDPEVVLTGADGTSTERTPLHRSGRSRKRSRQSLDRSVSGSHNHCDVVATVCDCGRSVTRDNPERDADLGVADIPSDMPVRDDRPRSGSAVLDGSTGLLLPFTPAGRGPATVAQVRPLLLQDHAHAIPDGGISVPAGCRAARRAAPAWQWPGSRSPIAAARLAPQGCSRTPARRPGSET